MGRQRANPVVTEINCVEQLESYRLAWNSLHQQTVGRTFFQTLDWLEAFCRHEGRGLVLRVLVITIRNQPIGILPLIVIPEWTRIGRVRVLTYPLHEWGTFFGPIGPNPTATLMIGMRHIRETERNWDLLDLRWVDRDQHDHLRTIGAMKCAGFSVREATWKRAAFVDVRGTWEDYWKTRSPKMRQNIGRQWRRLQELGDVRTIRYRPAGAARGEGDPRWELYDTCVELARRSWQGSSKTGTTLNHAHVSAFFREAHELAAKNGMLDVNLLTVSGRPVAFAYNYCCDGRIVGLRTGYDPAFKKHGVGNSLLMMTLRDSFLRSDHQLDLGIDCLPIKKRWATRLADSYRYTHYPISVPRVQLLRLKHLANSQHTSKAVNAAGS